MSDEKPASAADQSIAEALQAITRMIEDRTELGSMGAERLATAVFDELKDRHLLG